MATDSWYFPVHGMCLHCKWSSRRPKRSSGSVYMITS